MLLTYISQFVFDLYPIFFKKNYYKKKRGYILYILCDGWLFLVWSIKPQK